MRRWSLVVGALVAAAAVWWFGVREVETPEPDVLPATARAGAPEDPGAAQAKGPELEAKGEAPERGSEAAPSPLPEGGVTVTGRVLDERRRPVAGATLTLSVANDAPTTRSATSDADGRFELPGLVRPDGDTWRSFLVRASRGDLAGMGGSSVWAQSPDTIDVGVISLRTSQSLVVHVRDEAGAAVAGARVILDATLQWMRCVVARARTDSQGDCRFELLAENAYRVLAGLDGHGRATGHVELPRTDAGPLVLTLGPERPITVVVTDKDSGAPIAGATLLVEEVVRGALNQAQIVTYVPEKEGLATDARGRAPLAGIGADDEVQVHALAAGYAGPGSSRVVAGSPIVDGEIRLQLQKLRQVKWPIAAGGEHTPPEGTVLRLEQARGAMTAPLPSSARVEGDFVVAEACDPGLFHLVAIAPDGAYARMMALPDTNVGREITFERPRRVVAIVENADGTPAAGVYVSMRNQGNNVIVDPTPTGADGRLEVDVNYGWLLDVFVSRTPTPYGGTAIGSLDLKKGGGTVRGTLPAPGRRVELTVRIDGEARLPPAYGIGYGNQTPLELEEDPERGILRLRLPQADGPPKWSLSAEGFLTATFELPPGEEGATARVAVDLRRGGTCLVRVKPPADGKHQSNLRKEEGKASRFPVPPGMGAAPRSLGTQEGWEVVRHGPLEPGRYVAFDGLSRVQSVPIEVQEGEEATVDLDLSAVGTIRGTVDVPEGFEARQARVAMSGEGLYEDPFAGMRGDGAYVRPDGTFEIRVPGSRSVRLTVRHPSLIPAPSGGSVEVKGTAEKVRLVLVQGGTAVFRLDPPIEQSGQGSPTPTVQVQLHEGDPAGAARQTLTPIEKDGVFTIAGFGPGTYTLVVDAREHAPLAMKDVVLGDGSTDLGTLALTDGVTVRIKVKVKEGEDPPRVLVHATYKSPIAYSRYLNSRGEAEVLLKGLGAGTFELLAMSMRGFGSSGTTGGGKPLRETIESDGRTEIVRELDLR